MLAALQIAVLSALSIAAGPSQPVAEYSWAGQPHRDAVSVFQGIGKTYYLIPNRMELALRPDGSPTIGVQYSGFSGPTLAEHLVSVTASVRFPTTAAVLDEVSTSLRRHLAPEAISFGTLSLKLSLGVVTQLERDQALWWRPLTEVTTPLTGTSQQVTFDIVGLKGALARDLLDANGQRGGLVAVVEMSALDFPNYEIPLDKGAIKSIFRGLEFVDGAGGLATLVQAMVAATPACRSPQEVASLREWLMPVLGQPDLVRRGTDEEVGWLLTGAAMSGRIDQASGAIAIRPATREVTLRRYAAVPFSGLCSTFPSQIVDLDTLKPGCGGFGDR